jgi:hypothetical protein
MLGIIVDRGLLRCDAVWYCGWLTNVSEERTASTFRLGLAVLRNDVTTCKSKRHNNEEDHSADVRTSDETSFEDTTVAHLSV